MKSIVLHVYEDSQFNCRLAVALDLCRAFDAHLTCLQVTPFDAYVTFDPFGGTYSSQAVIDSLRERETQLREATESRLSHEDVRWDWAAVDGNVAQSIVAWSALSDLVVISQAISDTEREERTLPIVDDVVINADCAVLVVPANLKRIDPTAPIVIGWNASEQAARAVRQALPALRMASAVHIVSVGEDGMDFPQTAACSYLARHGISSELHCESASGESPGDVLQRIAIEFGASAIVMGAYGRSRLRETLLGGVTRKLTTRSSVPLMLAR